MVWLGLGLGCASKPIAAPAPPAKPAPGTTGVVLVLSDIHFDPFADSTKGSELVSIPAAEWRAKLRTYTWPPPPKHPLPDTSFPLLEAVLDEAKSSVPLPDFVIVAGDFLEHSFDRSFAAIRQQERSASLEEVAEKTIAFVTLELSSRFPEAPIFPVLGNNDSPCGDYEIPPRSAFLAFVARTWEGLANRKGGAPGFASSFAQGGYYTATLPVAPRTRLFGLNSVLWSSHRPKTCGAVPGSDPGKDELAWLEAELAKAESAGESAWLVSHIPPGVDVFATLKDGTQTRCQRDRLAMMYDDAYLGPFLDTLGRHAGVVAFALSGHTHMKDYRLYGHDGSPPITHQLVPSVSPSFGNNPAFSAIHFDRATGAVKDVEAHVLSNWAEAASGGRPRWNPPEVSPASLAVFHASVAADPAARALYVHDYNGGSEGASIAGVWRAYWCGNDQLTRDAFFKCQCELP
jgi:hypothetical protein